MKVPQKTVSALIVCMVACVATLYADQSEAPPPPGNPPAPTQPAVKNIVPPEAAEQAQAPSEQADPLAKTTGDPPAATAKPAAAGPGSEKPYIIGALDVLDIRVWGQPQVSGAVAVTQDGMVTLPLVGQIKADGLTAVQLQEIIGARLKDCCLNNPEVTATVAKVNSKRVYFYGGVLKQGAFPLIERTTIMDALSEVGFKEFANKKKITIQRGDQILYFNYEDFSKGKNKDKNPNIVLQSGDRIYVKE